MAPVDGRPARDTGSSPRPGGARVAPAALTALLAGLVSLIGCGDSQAAPRSEAPHDLAIFVFDRSGSISNVELARAQELTGRRILELDHGDRMVAMELLEASLEEPPRRWSQRVPLREYPDLDVASDSLARIRFLRNARDYMRRFTDTLRRDEARGTDILSTLHDVAADLRANPEHRATLYLFSDMLQANPQLNFETRTEPPAGWVQEASEAGTLPDLSGLCAVVVGARVDTRKAQAVKRFWLDYFAATGARLLDHNYMLRPVELPAAPCG